MYEVHGSKPSRRPNRTWDRIMQTNYQKYQARKLNKEDAMDHSRWRKLIKDG